ncbi:MAG: outer membrane lipoprotein-sorting protein [Flavobacteriaceae bacterium]|nr:outer membrane lipoprotein-sorting protein [Bacteroidia bacterium]MBT8289025.1 outer membrane lipoprotein-sorting protein [Bacteroidia bacterium]NNF74685.1 outer membrane lipoprotein-sorting protein [Flavobacteriaceae bacterium]RZV64253.1 MAG: outer membrane lipoprotein-sorting protein [Flavobacteriaceae bacterium]
MRLTKIILILAVFLSNSFGIAQDLKTGLEVMKTYQQRTQIDFLSSQINYRNHSKKGRIQERSLQQFIMRDTDAKDCYAFLLRFEAPRDVRGTSTLTIQNEKKADQQWLYLPALRMTKRISPSKKTGRFMGTELTYEDLNNYLSEPLDKYNYEILGREIIDQRDCYKIQAKAMDEEELRHSGYSARVIFIDKQNFTVLKTEFYDKSGKLLKIFKAMDIRQLNNGSQFRAFSVEIKNVQTGNWTEIFYKDIEIDKPIDDRIFTLNYLQSK